MYLVPTKTAVVEALRAVFATGDYPDVDFATTRVGIEYPVDRSDYPSVWVEYTDTEDVRQSGVGHVEQMTYPGGQNGSMVSEYTRFEFGGTVSLTVVALSSLERDRLYDQLVRVVGLGGENAVTARFRSAIESNDFIGLNVKYDSMHPTGNSSMPGTPWGTDEVIYERSLNIDIEGEFYIEPETGTLVLLSAINLNPLPTVDFTIADQEFGGGPVRWI